MPNYVNPLIIGSGPSAMSDIGAQQLQWARFNNGVDEANLARQAQANAQAQQQSNWLTQNAQAQADADATARQNAQRMASNNALTAGAAAEDKRRFDVGTGLSESQQAIERQKVTFTQEEKNAAEKKRLDEIANAATFMAPDSMQAAQDAQEAQAAYAKALSELDTIGSKTNPKVAPGRAMYDKGLHEWRPTGLATDAEKLAIDKANEQLQSAKANADSAKLDHISAQSALAQHQKTAQQYGLQIGSDGRVFSPAHNKTFGSPEADNSETVDVPPPNPLTAAPNHDPFSSAFQPGMVTMVGGGAMPQSPNPLTVGTGTTGTPRTLTRISIRPQSGPALVSPPQPQAPNPLTAGAPQPPAPQPMTSAVAPQPAAAGQKLIPLDERFDTYDPKSGHSVFENIGRLMAPESQILDERLKEAQRKYPGAKLVKRGGESAPSFGGGMTTTPVQYFIQLP